MNAIDSDTRDIALVSVVIPCYHCANTIGRAVDSIAKQTLRPLEVILVNDGSEDDTLEVMKELVSNYPPGWLKVINLTKNYGVSTARNIGWDASSNSSQFIAFLDADDAWLPNKIQLQYAWMTLHPGVMVTGHKAFMVNPDSSSAPLYSPIEKFTADFIPFKKLLASNPFVTPSFMIQRNIKLRFDPKSRYAEDYYFLLRIGADGHQIVILTCPLVWVFKEFGISGASKYLLKMRLGDLNNYYQLWYLKKINFLTMIICILFSSLKFSSLIILGPKRHESFNRWLNNSHDKI